MYPRPPIPNPKIIFKNIYNPKLSIFIEFTIFPALYIPDRSPIMGHTNTVYTPNIAI